MEEQIRRKELGRGIKDNKETIINEYFKGEFVTSKEIEELMDIYGDSEESNGMGLGMDFNGDLCFIEIDKLIHELESSLHGDDLTDYTINIFVKLLEKIKKLKGNTIWI